MTKEELLNQIADLESDADDLQHKAKQLYSFIQTLSKEVEEGFNEEDESEED